jgi:hypothetical protein
MKRYLLLLILTYISAAAATISQPIVNISGDNAVIKIAHIDVGISGFIVKHIDKDHSYIIDKAIVTAFDPTNKKAVLRLSPYKQISQPYLASMEYHAAVGDEAILAFGYDRALLIAPSSDTYYRIKNALPSLEWVHPDIFATLLSSNGHPTPLKKDFHELCDTSAIGLLYIYIDANLFTLDCQSMHILQITPAPIKQTSTQLPFYNRIGTIDANWFGAGSSRLKAYAPYYFKLLVRNNPTNKKLYELIKDKEPKLHSLLQDFTLKDTK